MGRTAPKGDGADSASPPEGFSGSPTDAGQVNHPMKGEKAPDFRLQAASHDIGAAWKKTSEAGREYISVTLDDPSFPATVYARLIENEDGTHALIWSRSTPKAA